MVVVTQVVVAVVNVGVAIETEGVVFVKNNTCVVDFGGDIGLEVKVDLKFGGTVFVFVVTVVIAVNSGGFRFSVLTLADNSALRGGGVGVFLIFCSLTEFPLVNGDTALAT